MRRYRLYHLLILGAALIVLGAAVQPSRTQLALAQAPSVCGQNPSPPDPLDPAIVVWDPVPGAFVSSPVIVRGEARVFEATVQLVLEAAGGREIARGFTTAAEAGPAMAPFEGSLAFSVSRETQACLLVFEESARDGSRRNVVQVPLTLVPETARYTEAGLNLGELRPCIPVSGETRCDAARLALWNGEAEAWAARGVTDPDARFNETVVLRVRAGDPAAIRNIARILGQPYLQIARLKFAGSPPEFVEIANLGGGSQDVGGWTVRSPDRDAVARLPGGLVVEPGQSCRVYSDAVRSDSCGGIRFQGEDVWPEAGGRAVLYADPIDLPAADTRYDAAPTGQPPPPNIQGVVVAGDAPDAEGFVFRLSTPRAMYRAGESIPFEMVLRNANDRAQTLTFLGGQDFDIVVRNSAGAEVWRWSTGRAFTQQIRTVSFAPGEERRFAATWDQRSNAGEQAPAGGYQATATTATRSLIASNTIPLQIESAPSAVEFGLSTSKETYAIGEPIEFSMVARNRSSQVQTIEFPSGQDFDLVVRTMAGADVWRYSTSRSFVQVIRTVTLQPGESVRFSSTWDQRTDTGQQVSPGVYRATATLTTTNGVQSNTVELRIQ